MDLDARTGGTRWLRSRMTETQHRQIIVLSVVAPLSDVKVRSRKKLRTRNISVFAAIKKQRSYRYITYPILTV